MVRVSSKVVIPENEIVLQAVRSQGAGGQNVNKVSTAIQLFFDVRASPFAGGGRRGDPGAGVVAVSGGGAAGVPGSA